MIKYQSKNGYTGMIYGEKSLKIVNHKGETVLHTAVRQINNMPELVEFVDDFPNQRTGLLMLYERLSK